MRRIDDRDAVGSATVQGQHDGAAPAAPAEMPPVAQEARSTPIEIFATERLRLRRGDMLYRNRSPFKALYLVRYGFFKTVCTLSDGREQLTGFQLAGDLLGLDALASGRHASEVTALEGSEVAVVPYAWSEDPPNPPELVQLVHRALSREIVRDHGMLLMLGSMLAEQRVAVFLLSLSERLRERGYSRSEFVLRMTRGEMGSFLGMRLATVCRCVTRLVRAGIIDVDQKYVRIVAPDRLREMASTGDGSRESAHAARPAPGRGACRREDAIASLV